MFTARERAAIAKVVVSQEGEQLSWGTGFLVGPSTLLTALHVLEQEGAAGADVRLRGDNIALQFPGHGTTAVLAGEHWDRDRDWALLTCVQPPPGVAPLPMARLEQSAEFRSFGFPEANPEGMELGGQVVDPRAQHRGIEALQLYALQAAAGTGMPVKGLSGAPLLVGANVVGLLRSSLLAQGHAVAGTLYATSVDGLGLPLQALAHPGPVHAPYDPRQVYEQLADLLPSQFEEVIFRAGVKARYLSGAAAPQATRAQELIRYCEHCRTTDKLLDALREVLG